MKNLRKLIVIVSTFATIFFIANAIENDLFVFKAVYVVLAVISGSIDIAVCKVVYKKEMLCS